MEVLVLMDFEATMPDELTVAAGDVVKGVSKAGEEGWLQGELGGKKGIFPANFVKEVPAYLTGDSKREPRSIRQVKKPKPTRQCEVTYAYTPTNLDELKLDVGEILDVIREIEDGWWMGMKDGKVGAFPSNFVKEIFVLPKDGKYGEGKVRPRLADAVFNRENSQKASVRRKAKNVTEYCQVMFDYKGKAEDELDLKKGEIVVVLKKDTEDEGWWQGEINGRCGFFPDNFVMVIPPMENLESGDASQLPARTIDRNPTVRTVAPGMDRGGLAKMKDDKPEAKDLRSNPPTKFKLPSFSRPSPPPVKDKPSRVLPKNNDEAAPVLAKQQQPEEEEEKDSEFFDTMDGSTEKLSHPTADRARPPQRRPPSGLVPAAQGAVEEPGPEASPQKSHTPDLPKAVDHLVPMTAKPARPKTPPAVRPPAPKVMVDGEVLVHKEEVTMEQLHAEIKELRMAMELLQTRHERDLEEVKEELREEKTRRQALQEEVHSLKLRH